MTKRRKIESSCVTRIPESRTGAADRTASTGAITSPAAIAGRRREAAWSHGLRPLGQVRAGEPDGHSRCNLGHSLSFARSAPATVRMSGDALTRRTSTAHDVDRPMGGCHRSPPHSPSSWRSNARRRGGCVRQPGPRRDGLLQPCSQSAPPTVWMLTVECSFEVEAPRFCHYDRHQQGYPARPPRVADRLAGLACGCRVAPHPWRYAPHSL